MSLREHKQGGEGREKRKRRTSRIFEILFDLPLFPSIRLVEVLGSLILLLGVSGIISCSTIYQLPLTTESRARRDRGVGKEDSEVVKEEEKTERTYEG